MNKGKSLKSNDMVKELKKLVRNLEVNETEEGYLFRVSASNQYQKEIEIVCYHNEYAQIDYFENYEEDTKIKFINILKKYGWKID